MPGIYNPFEHPRRVRGELKLPSLEECRAIMAEIRQRVLQRMSLVDLESPDPLLHDGYVYSMVLQHEYQHNETILQTLQLKEGMPYRAPRAYPARKARRATGGMVRFGGGRVRLGTDDRHDAYDNERPSHEADVAPFSVDVYPVTNGDFLEFIREGGYARRDLWSDAGWSGLPPRTLTRRSIGCATATTGASA
jgi:iron(II)-dependent oxidoreductase